jgi:hypothetical protein
MGKIFLITGLVGLCHAAYSATQHRNYLRLTEHEFSRLPLDIIFQTVISLFLSCIGIISIASKFKPIKITSEWENKIWDNIANRTSFYSFNHRGKYLFSSLEEDSQIEIQLRKEELLEQQELRRKKQLKEQEQQLLQQKLQQRKSKNSSSEEEEVDDQNQGTSESDN